MDPPIAEPKKKVKKAHPQIQLYELINRASVLPHRKGSDQKFFEFSQVVDFFSTKKEVLKLIEEAKDSGILGWNSEFLGQGMIVSEDGLTATKTNSNGFAGVLGAQLFSSGCHDFAFKVHEPVDDHFWIGIAYTDVYADEAPKVNTKTIVWSGGSDSRPGTVRIHGEKMRNQPTYKHGDIIGVSLDLDSGDLLFYLNGQQVIEWRGVLRGPVYPFFSVHHAGPSATLLQHWSQEETGEERSRIRDVVGGSSVESLPDVDGSKLEGGGQVLRIALVDLGCCALLKRPLRIHSIRAGRPKPGLGHQHSTGAKLVADICFGMVKPEQIQYGGHCECVNELYLWPGTQGLRGGEFIADPHSAGSITLLIQAALPCALIGERPTPVKMILRGGTNVSGSPPIDFTKICLFPFLSKFGVTAANLDLQIVHRGFYPLGRGEVIVNVNPVKHLNAITLLDRGEPVSITGVICSSGTGRKVAKDISPLIKGLLKVKFGDIPIEITLAEEPEGPDPAAIKAKPSKKMQDDNANLTMKERKAVQEERRLKFAGAAGCQLVLQTTTGCYITGSSLVQDTGKSASGVIPAKDVANGAALSLIDNWEAGGCVDEYLMDQLILFMAVAKGTSKVLCPGPSKCSSEHLVTAIHFVELLVGVKFILHPEGPKGERIIECTGTYKD